MFGIGMPELILILVIALIVIGPKKLPDLAKSLGRAMREFKTATNELKDSMELDHEIKDVKSAFDDVSGDIKGSFLDSNGANNDDAAGDKKVKDLEESYDEWKREDKPPVTPVTTLLDGIQQGVGCQAGIVCRGRVALGAHFCVICLWAKFGLYSR